MNCEQAIEFIEGRSVFGSRPGFERINALLEGLNHPENGLEYVHVAGTNGKGSVCNELANILSASGRKTGLFTSPFVSDFRERIQIDGEYIKEDRLAALSKKVKDVCDKLDEEGNSPTEFEVITAIAFLYYKEENCDIVVLEVGLGGLLDSTNVIPNPPVVSAITSLSIDHTAVLGETIEEITMHKAGIIKPGGITVTTANQPEGAMHVLRTAAFLNDNKLICAQPENIELVSESIDGMTVHVSNDEYMVPLVGKHQIDNLALTLEVVGAMNSVGYDITPEHIRAGLLKTRIPARAEVMSDNPLVIIDGGHNAEGAMALRTILDKHLSSKRLIVVTGVMADKDVDGVMERLTSNAAKVITTTPNSSRSMAAEELASIVRKYCADVIAEPVPTKAVDIALEEISSENDALVICGSLYLAGDVRGHIINVLNNI